MGVALSGEVRHLHFPGDLEPVCPAHFFCCCLSLSPLLFFMYLFLEVVVIGGDSGSGSSVCVCMFTHIREQASKCHCLPS